MLASVHKHTMAQNINTSTSNNNTSAEKLIPSKFTIDVNGFKIAALNVLNNEEESSSTKNEAKLSNSKSYSKSSKSSLVKFYGKKSKKGSSSSKKSSKRGSGKGNNMDNSNQKTTNDFDIVLVSAKNVASNVSVSNSKTNSAMVNASKTNNATMQSSNNSQIVPASTSTSTSSFASSSTSTSNTTSPEITTISALIDSPNGQTVPQKQVSIGGVGIALIISTLLALSLFAMLFSKIVKRKKRMKEGILHGSRNEDDQETYTNSYKRNDMGLVDDVCKDEITYDETIDDTYSDFDTNITSANQSTSSGIDLYHFEPRNNEELNNIDFSDTSIDMVCKMYADGPTDETVVL